MVRRVNPFTPSRPVRSPDRFSGRISKVSDVVNTLFQLKEKNPEHSIITGDRGIGKSSLLLQTKLLAEGDNTLIKKFDLDSGGVESFNFLCAWHDADSDQSAEDVASGLLSEIDSFSSLLAKIDIEIDIMGFLSLKKKDPDSKTANTIVREFCNRISKVATKLDAINKDGLLLIIDEIDRLDETSGIATFIKLCTEKLSRDGIDNVVFFCSGISGAIQKMKDEHPSISRTFKEISIERLTVEESGEILSNGFNQLKLPFDSEVLTAAHKMSGGFPEIIHLVGSEIIKINNFDRISLRELDIAKKEVVTNKKNDLESSLRDAGSGKYQLILKAMATYNGAYVPLTYVSEQLGLKQNEYSTNISNLTKREVILKADRGIYSFTDPLLKEYIRHFGVIDYSQTEDEFTEVDHGHKR